MNDNTKLDKFYTKNNIVELCTKNINTILNIDYKKDLVIEPSVGNGSFINSINKLCKNKIFIEIDKSHEQSLYNKYKFKKNELIFLDYLDFDYYNIKNIYNNIHVIGNPPFGTKSSQAIKFIKHSCKFCDSFSFILPKSFKKDSLIEKIPENFHNLLTIDLSLNSFFYNNINYNVPCIFVIYIKKNYIRENIIKNIPNDFIFVKKYKPHDISIRRVGCKTGYTDLSVNSENKSEQSHYFIKFLKANINNDIIIKLNNITNLECIQNTVGQKSISKNELIKFINDLNI
tara:strand:- start:178 stop:1038 length:861 start_codon:yes stop_codon:yes gene_type:complete